MGRVAGEPYCDHHGRYPALPAPEVHVHLRRVLLYRGFHLRHHRGHHLVSDLNNVDIKHFCILCSVSVFFVHTRVSEYDVHTNALQEYPAKEADDTQSLVLCC